MKVLVCRRTQYISGGGCENHEYNRWQPERKGVKISRSAH